MRHLIEIATGIPFTWSTQLVSIAISIMCGSSLLLLAIIQRLNNDEQRQRRGLSTALMSAPEIRS